MSKSKVSEPPVKINKKFIYLQDTTVGQTQVSILISNGRNRTIAGVGRNLTKAKPKPSRANIRFYRSMSGIQAHCGGIRAPKGSGSSTPHSCGHSLRQVCPGARVFPQHAFHTPGVPSCLGSPLRLLLHSHSSGPSPVLGCFQGLPSCSTPPGFALKSQWKPPEASGLAFCTSVKPASRGGFQGSLPVQAAPGPGPTTAAAAAQCLADLGKWGAPGLSSKDPALESTGAKSASVPPHPDGPGLANAILRCPQGSFSVVLGQSTGLINHTPWLKTCTHYFVARTANCSSLPTLFLFAPNSHYPSG